MSNKIYESRIQLKYDTYENWSENNPIPLMGEVCVVVVPPDTGAVTQEPAILFKVGNGSDSFSMLPYVSGYAADVYDWAKAAAKPSYTANEIEGLANYISGKVQDTNTQYKLEQDIANEHNLKLFKKDLTDNDWQLVSTIVTADTIYDDTEVRNSISDIESLVGSTSVAAQIANAIDVLNLANTYEAKGAAKAVQGGTTATVKNVEDSLTAIKDGDTIDSFRDVENALENKQPVGDYATKTEAQSYADAKDEAIAAAKSTGDAAMEEAEAKVASVTAGDNSVIIGGTSTSPTVAAKLSDDADNAIELAEDGLKVVIPAAAEYSLTKDETSADYAAVYHLTKDGVNVGASINIPKDMVVESGSVVVLSEDEVEGYAAGTYIRLVLANANEDVLYINVNGLIEYVTSGSDSNDMVVISVDDNHEVTATITDGSITLVKLSTEIQTAIGKAHTHDNKNVLDDIDATKITAWDNAEKNAKDYADGLADNYDYNGAAKAVQGNTTSTVKDAMDAVALKANDADLAVVAKSGKIEDMIQDSYIILNCGSSSTVI